MRSGHGLHTVLKAAHLKYVAAEAPRRMSLHTGFADSAALRKCGRLEYACERGGRRLLRNWTKHSPEHKTAQALLLMRF